MSSNNSQIILETELYVVTDVAISNYRDQKYIIRSALAGGARMIQFRDKRMDISEFTEMARELRREVPKGSALFIINDYADVSKAVGADGVHLGQDDMPVAEARSILGEDAVIGLSTHSVEQAKDAHKLGVDYFNVGPIFPTRTKEGGASQVGTGLITEIKSFAKIPFTTMGGINLSKVDQVIKAGADRVAVVSAAVGAENVEAACRNLIRTVRKVKLERSIYGRNK
jgi:thiamine-phosphate pyrophosphorylase